MAFLHWAIGTTSYIIWQWLLGLHPDSYHYKGIDVSSAINGSEYVFTYQTLLYKMVDIILQMAFNSTLAVTLSLAIMSAN